MSTEKDREDAEKISRNEVLPNPRLELEHVDEVMKTWLDYHYKGVLAGIQHARQGEHAMLIKFITWVRNHYAVNAVIDNKGMVDFYLEQEKQV